MLWGHRLGHIRPKLWLIMVFVSVCSPAFASAGKTLTFYTWSEDLAPILSLKSSGNGRVPSGIVVDVLSGWSAQQGHTIKYTLHNRVRGEEALYAGEVDMTILSREWLVHPDKLLFSLPLYEHREYLFALEHPESSVLPEMLDDTLICTHRGYRYPSLQKYFELGIARRVESHDEFALFGMLDKGRCDFAVSNELVAEHVIERHGWQSRFLMIRPPLEKISFTLALHPDNAALLPSLNAHIEQLNHTRKLSQIIAYHRSIMVLAP